MNQPSIYDAQTRSYSRTEHPLMSESVRAAFRAMLKPVPLKKGDGEFEIGVEHNKLEIKHALEALLGGSV